MQNHSPQGPAQKELSEKLPNPSERNSFTNLKSTGQKGRSFLGYSQGMEAAGRHFWHFPPTHPSSSYSPSTNHSPECQNSPEGSSYTPLIPSFYMWCPWPYGCNSGEAPDHFALAGLWGLHSWVPWAITTGKAALGRLSSQGYCTDSRQKHILSLSEKEAYS